jgi:hypothetical protein
MRVTLSLRTLTQAAHPDPREELEEGAKKRRLL